MAKKKTSSLNPEMLDELLTGQDPATVLRSDGLFGDLKCSPGIVRLLPGVASHWS